MTIRAKMLTALAVVGSVALSLPAQAAEGRNAAAVAGVIGGLALGAAGAAGAAGPRAGYVDQGGPDCYYETRRVWDDYRDAYRVRRIRVCD